MPSFYWEDREGCQNGDHDIGAHYGLLADARFFLMASLWRDLQRPLRSSAEPHAGILFEELVSTGRVRR